MPSNYYDPHIKRLSTANYSPSNGASNNHMTVKEDSNSSINQNLMRTVQSVETSRKMAKLNSRYRSKKEVTQDM